MGMGRVRYLDAHTHIGIATMPEHCYEYLRRVGLRPNPWPPAEEAAKMFSNEAVECVGVVLIPSFPCANSDAVEGVYQQAEYAKDMRQFYHLFGTVNPNCDIDVVAELQNQYSKLEIVGIKLHPVHQAFSPNDYLEKGNRRLEKIYEFAQDHGLPVMFHTGTSVGVGSRNRFGDPIYIDDVATDFPRLKIIVAHAGRPIWCQTAFTLARIHQNVFLELSNIPPRRLREYFPRLDEIKHKAIYGSDYPAFAGQVPALTAQEFSGVVGADGAVMLRNIADLIGLKL